jgi:hypothetical protein
VFRDGEFIGYSHSYDFCQRSLSDPRGFADVSTYGYRSVGKCAVVTASETVHLRPSPNTTGYPIEVLANGVEVVDLGGRVENDLGTWWYVNVGKNQGWINGKYLDGCK